MDETVVLSVSPKKHCSNDVVCDFSESSSTFNSKQLLFSLGDGRSFDASCNKEISIPVGKSEFSRLCLLGS